MNYSSNHSSSNNNKDNLKIDHHMVLEGTNCLFELEWITKPNMNFFVSREKTEEIVRSNEIK